MKLKTLIYLQILYSDWLKINENIIYVVKH